MRQWQRRVAKSCSPRGSRRESVAVSGKVADGLRAAGTTFGIAGAVASTGMAGSALPGHEGDYAGQNQGLRTSSQQQQRGDQTRGHRRDTTTKGRGRSGSSGKR